MAVRQCQPLSSRPTEDLSWRVTAEWLSMQLCSFVACDYVTQLTCQGFDCYCCSYDVAAIVLNWHFKHEVVLATVISCKWTLKMCALLLPANADVVVHSVAYVCVSVCLSVTIQHRAVRNIIRTALCWIVWHNVHSLQHTRIWAVLTRQADRVCHIGTGFVTLGPLCCA